MAQTTHNGIGPRPGRHDLPPRLIRQVLNPFKVRPDGLEWAFPLLPVRAPVMCIGHFFDSRKMCAVHIKMGEVIVRTNSFRAVPSGATDRSLLLFRGCAEKPFEGEGAARSEFADETHRPKRSEVGADSSVMSGQFQTVAKGQKCSGSYVIPGQSLMGETESEKTLFEWSAEKCEAELC